MIVDVGWNYNYLFINNCSIVMILKCLFLFVYLYILLFIVNDIFFFERVL